VQYRAIHDFGIFTILWIISKYMENVLICKRKYSKIFFIFEIIKQ
jgi:hypothetical protein